MSDTVPETESLSRKTPEIPALAQEMTDKLVAEIEKQPENHAAHLQLLEDSRHLVIREAAKMAHFHQADGNGDQEFLWNMAVRLPQFNISALYRKRASLLALAAAIVAGWFLGGLIASILDLLGLGGEILRPLAIFLVIWLEEYISLNPRARKIVLSILGFGGLARFASMAMGGLFRFTGFGSLRQAVFGVARPNIFKFLWLMAGAIFIIVFFSRKVTGLDIPAFKQDLLVQLEQRLSFALYVLAEMKRQEDQLERLRMEIENGGQQREHGKAHKLARAISSVLPAMDINTRKFLRSALAENGFELQGNNEDIFVWHDNLHSQLYTSIGLIADGERARILQEPYIADGKIVKGHAQKIQ